MRLNDIFEKDINRQIDGVIKADDDSQIGVEVDEYVLTNEASKGLEQLLEAYTQTSSSANGAWVSGFFGSGKSHLLKMLAHLLGTTETSGISREKAIEAFLTKAGDNAILVASLKKSATIPAKSLLFNIDQKADLVAKDQSDALLKVFAMVFDDSCGYFGKMAYIAQFERDLDNDNRLAEFKEIYANIAQMPWEKGRKQSILQEANVDAAYARLNGSERAPEGILAKYSNEYHLSIEDFANNVKDWLDSQPAGTRLNFYVDEVGQFIAGNTKLMLNLQTIAETLAVRCDMRAWVMVTSQEDMSSVIGDPTKQQGNDFSKIQARFANRLKLTSADVEEVIQKRLLQKKPSGVSMLQGIYADEINNFATLFTFTDGSRTYRNFSDEDHFIASYPFVTYQFPLFQSALSGISDHNGFEGKHTAVGERSMLEVFQHVAQNLTATNVGELATFDATFEGIRATLKSANQKSILFAEDNLKEQNPLAIRVLKALFLVKYVPDFKATHTNVTVLLYGAFGQDVKQLSKSVQEALNLLEQQTYIQRNGTLYEYLTNDEKDIEEDIKNVEIDSSTLTSELGRLVHEVLKNPKIRYTKNGQDFSYSLKVDDVLVGRPQELTIDIITPENEFAGDLAALRAHSFGKNELRVVLPEDGRLIPDVLSYLRTAKYVKHAQTNSMTDSHRRILQSKGRQNDERHRELATRLRDLLGKSTLMVAGSDLTISASDGPTRVEQGFQNLVTGTYPQLKLLGNKTYSEADIASALADTPSTLDPDAATPLSPAERELFNHISLKEQAAESVTVATLVAAFEVKPYGWSMAATLTALARMVTLGRVTLTVDANRLKRTEVAAGLKNTQRQSKTYVSVQQQYTPSQTRAIRDFYRDFFDDAASPREAGDAAKACAAGFNQLADKLELRIDTSAYPFTAGLGPIVVQLREYSTKPEKWLVEDLPAHVPELLDTKELAIDPIVNFFAGPQKPIFDTAKSALSRAQFSGAAGAPSAETVRTLIGDPDLLSGGKLSQLKTASDELEALLNQQVDRARDAAQVAIKQRAQELTQIADDRNATDVSRSAVENALEQLLAHIGQLDNSATIEQAHKSFIDVQFPHLIDTLRPPKAEPGPSPADPPKPQAETVGLSTLSIHFSQNLLQNEADVDNYLDALRKTLMDEINAGKRVSR